MSESDRGREDQRVAVVVLAAGSGSRLQSVTNKAFLPLGDRAIVAWSVAHALALPDIAHCLLVVAEADRQLAESMLQHDLPGASVQIVVGGATRHESELNALQHLAEPIATGDIDVVAIHDGARPFASTELFAQVIALARQHGGAIPGRFQPAVVTVDENDVVSGDLMAVQTPQAFRAQALLAAYELAAADGFVGTDTASCLERYSPIDVWVADGSADNLKITYPADLDVAAQRLGRLG